MTKLKNDKKMPYNKIIFTYFDSAYYITESELNLIRTMKK